MNNSEIAKKHGIIEETYYSEECIDFYSNVEKEVFIFQTTGLNNLINSGYTLDDNAKYYVKNNTFEKYYFNECEIQKLSSLRDTLLPKLMTGEIDVSEIDI